MRNSAVVRSVALFGAVTFAGACGGVEDQSIESSSHALTTSDFFDASGKVHIKVKVCDWSPSSQRPAALCTVDSGYVLVGGGAEVEGSASGGGLLTHSFPVNKTTWAAASKDQVTPFSHRIRAYAVGMSLADMSTADLTSMVTINSATSGESNRPSATAVIPSGDVILSGGAAIGYHGAGILLTESYPSGFDRWTVSGKDHQIADTGSATAFVVSVPVCLNNNWIWGCLRPNIQSNSTSVSTGYGVTTVGTPVGFAPTGVGGRARWSGAGRLLTDIFPLTTDGGQGATVFSKDHNLAEGNVTDAWVFSVQRF